jgi:excisionase family DNA binding protein
MTERRYVTTAEVSAALGVSVTTVKRWVDEGILPAHKTVGGHRKLLLTGVLRIIREGNFPRLDLSRLNLPTQAEAGPDPAALAGRLLAGLTQPGEEDARLLLQEAYRGGMAVESLADAVVAPAMAQLGREWEEGRIDVFHEHRGSQICAAALYSLKAVLHDHAGSGRPVAVGGGPDKDPYFLAPLLAELVLVDAGWEAVNFGANTPLASFRKALAEYRPRLLWLSVSSLADPESFVREYRELYQDATRARAAVALGGRALTGEVRAALPCTTFGGGMAHLAAFARSLHPRPPRPRRGRPRGSGTKGTHPG